MIADMIILYISIYQKGRDGMKREGEAVQVVACRT